MNPDEQHGQPPKGVDDDEAPQPAAYDPQGRPLYYAAPPSPQQPAQQQSQPQMVYMSRPLEMQDIQVPADIMQRHEESRKKYPHLNLSTGEYVISAVKRHPIGLIKIWSIGVVLILAFMAITIFLLLGGSSNYSGNLMIAGVLGLSLVTLLVLIGTFIATYIYNSNRFYLTNESVIQEIQTGLFAKHEQTVSLANIEDASYRQNGILPAMLNYGAIRLSTEGEETTYRFNYVTNPMQQVAVLNNAVEAFKMGRPVH